MLFYTKICRDVTAIHSSTDTETRGLIDIGKVCLNVTVADLTTNAKVNTFVEFYVTSSFVFLLLYSKKSLEPVEPSIEPFDYFKRGHFLAPLCGLNYFEEDAPPRHLPPPPTTGNQSLFLWCLKIAIIVLMRPKY